MPPLIDATVSPCGEPETLSERLIALCLAIPYGVRVGFLLMVMLGLLGVAL